MTNTVVRQGIIDACDIEKCGGGGDGEAVEGTGSDNRSSTGSIENEGQLPGEQAGVGCTTAFSLVLEERGQTVLLSASDPAGGMLGRFELNRRRDIGAAPKVLDRGVSFLDLDVTSDESVTALVAGVISQCGLRRACQTDRDASNNDLSWK